MPAHKAEKPHGSDQSMMRCSWIHEDTCLWFARIKYVQRAMTKTQ